MPVNVPIESLPAHEIPEIPPVNPPPAPIPPTPEPEINVTTGKEFNPGKTPPKLKLPRSLHSITEIDAALTRCQGNRQATATMLGITVDQLKSRVHDEPLLNSRWSRSGMNQRAVEEMRAAKNLTTIPIAGDPKAMLLSAQADLMQQRNKLWTRIEAIEARITRGEAALVSNDPEFVNRNSFKLSGKNEPREEQMLREDYARLIGLDLKIQHQIASAYWIFHKMEHMNHAQMGSRATAPKQVNGDWLPKQQKIKKSPAAISQREIVIEPMPNESFG